MTARRSSCTGTGRFLLATPQHDNYSHGLTIIASVPVVRGTGVRILSIHVRRCGTIVPEHIRTIVVECQIIIQRAAASHFF